MGSHSSEVEEQGDDQFEIDDNRDVDVIRQMILDQGMQPVMNDYVFV